MISRDQLVWMIKGASPDTVPMARLAEYMKQLSALLGQHDDIRFVRIEKGSLRVVTKAARAGFAGQVTRRVSGLTRAQGPQEALRAYARLNEMVAEDGGTARLIRGSAVILHFSGTRVDAARPLRMLDHGFITGKLYAMAQDARGGDVKARIRLASGSNSVSCTASSAVGRHLRSFLFEAVRAHGKGEWERTGDGTWICQSLHIDRVEPVRNVSLRAAIDEIRAAEIEWPDDPLGELDELNDAGGQV
ncbi:hypothetical protein EBL89_03705 [Cereibacter sphaeroides]|nr:hypothetical protein EBL89_03705 [Cereibacter sphaeroides]RIA01372.1 hypothetical protein D1122_01540 [Cereibacter sphaeroides]